MQGPPLMRGRWLNGRVFSWAAWLAATGCAVGPNYQRPSVDMPATWQPDAPWRAAAPDDAAVKGDWWGAFGDLKLDALVDQIGRAHV